MIRFYAPDINTNPVLPEGESTHCVKILRMQPGNSIEVIDGKGNAYTCRLLDAHHKHALVEILEQRHEPLSWEYHLTVAVAPTKHMDRMEWLIEKLTEIGVNRFIPTLCGRSERKEIKTERLEKIAISAMKQSLKAVLPKIDDITPIKKIITECNAKQRFICYCDDSVERRTLAKECTCNTDTFVLIGPEGDFTIEEVNLAIANGFIPITLGANRLRTETAALFAATQIHTINQLL